MSLGAFLVTSSIASIIQERAVKKYKEENFNFFLIMAICLDPISVSYLRLQKGLLPVDSIVIASRIAVSIEPQRRVNESSQQITFNSFNLFVKDSLTSASGRCNSR